MSRRKPRRDARPLAWDPERKRHVPVSPVEVTIGTSTPPHRTVPRLLDASAMDWLGEPPTDAQAAAYEVRRAMIIKEQEQAK